MDVEDGGGVEGMKRTLSSSAVMRRPLLDVASAAPGVSTDLEEAVVASEPATAGPVTSVDLEEPAAGAAPAGSDAHGVGGGERSSTARATFVTIKSIVGVGVLSFPFAFAHAGLVFGLLSVVLIALSVNYGMRLLIAVKVEVNRGRRPSDQLSSYEELARAVAGPWGYWTAVLAVLVTQLGIGCAYVLFVATELNSIEPLAKLSVQLWAVCVSPVFVGLCLIRNLRNLAPFSAFGLVAVVFALVVVLFYGLSHNGARFERMSVMPTNYFLFVGMAVFAFEGINLAVPVHSNMQHPASYGAMLNASFAVIGVSYATFAVLAYACFLDQTKSIITDSLPNTWIVLVAKTCVCINVAATFPVQVFPALYYVERAVFRTEETSWRTRGYWLRNLLRAGVVGGVIAVSVAIPYFEVVVSLVGGLGNGTAGFVLPAVLYLLVFRGRSPAWKTVLNWGIAVLGVVLAILVTAFAIVRMVERIQAPAGSNATRTEWGAST